eukprot:RCo009535
MPVSSSVAPGGGARKEFPGLRMNKVPSEQRKILPTSHSSGRTTHEVREVTLLVRDFSQFSYDEKLAWCFQKPELLSGEEQGSKLVEVLDVGRTSSAPTLAA